MRPIQDIILHGSIGAAFVPPAASQLSIHQYISGNSGPLYLGNPNLDPETSQTTDFGLSLDHAAWGFSSDATAFLTDIQGDIVTTTDGAGNYTYANLAGTSQIQGLELEWSEDLGKLAGSKASLAFHGNITHIWRAYGADSPAGSPQIDMLNIDAHKVLLGLDYDDHHRFSFGVSGRFRGQVLDYDYDSSSYPYPQMSYPSVWVYGLSGALKLGQGQKLRLYVDNLGDTYYYEKAGYPEPGRTYKAEFSQEF